MWTLLDIWYYPEICLEVTKKDHKERQPQISVSAPILELDTSRIGVRSVTS
jgi:hypothetical protein